MMMRHSPAVTTGFSAHEAALAGGILVLNFEYRCEERVHALSLLINPGRTERIVSFDHKAWNGHWHMDPDVPMTLCLSFHCVAELANDRGILHACRLHRHWQRCPGCECDHYMWQGFDDKNWLCTVIWKNAMIWDEVYKVWFEGTCDDRDLELLLQHVELVD